MSTSMSLSPATSPVEVVVSCEAILGSRPGEVLWIVGTLSKRAAEETVLDLSIRSVTHLQLLLNHLLLCRRVQADEGCLLSIVMGRDSNPRHITGSAALLSIY